MGVRVNEAGRGDAPGEVNLDITAQRRQLADLRDAIAAKGGAVAAAVLAADTVWLALVAVAACAWLAAGTYNPFIYFRF